MNRSSPHFGCLYGTISHSRRPDKRDTLVTEYLCLTRQQHRDPVMATTATGAGTLDDCGRHGIVII